MLLYSNSLSQCNGWSRRMREIVPEGNWTISRLSSLVTIRIFLGWWQEGDWWREEWKEYRSPSLGIQKLWLQFSSSRGHAESAWNSPCRTWLCLPERSLRPSFLSSSPHSSHSWRIKPRVYYHFNKQTFFCTLNWPHSSPKPPPILFLSTPQWNGSIHCKTIIIIITFFLQLYTAYNARCWNKPREGYSELWRRRRRRCSW